MPSQNTCLGCLGSSGSLNSTKIAQHIYIMQDIVKLNDFFSASIDFLVVYTSCSLLHSIQSIVKPVLL